MSYVFRNVIQMNHAQHREDDLVRRSTPQSRRHRLNVRVEQDLYVALRQEAEDAGMSLSAVIRLALREGVRHVTRTRQVREALPLRLPHGNPPQNSRRVAGR